MSPEIPTHIERNTVQLPSFKVHKKLYSWLVVILAIRISTYFMVSESVAITRAYKIGGRLILTGLTFCMPFLINNFNEFRSRIEQVQLLPPLFYILYLWLGIASLLWTSSVEVSALQLFMDIETFVFTYYFFYFFLQIPQEGKTANLTFGRILWVAIAINILGILIGSLINPEAFFRATHGGNVNRLGGFIINPNELGMLIVLGLGGIGMEWVQKKINGISLLMGITFAYALFLTSSRSSMICCALLIVFLLLRSGRKDILLIGLFVGMFVGPFIFNEVFLKEGDLDEVTNMTGRLPFWEDLWNFNVPRKPLLGYGFMRIDELDKFPAIHSYAGAMTHNTFLQVLLNLGLIGIAIVFAQMAFTIRGISQMYLKEPWVSSLFIAMFIPLFINSLTEFGIWGETNYGIMFYLFIVWGVSMQRKKKHV